MKKEGPSFEDYLAAGALANVPLWIYLFLLTFDAGRYSSFNPTIFFTVIPVIAMVGGGFVASYIVCRRGKRQLLRVGIFVGVSATIVNFVFGLVVSAPSTLAATTVSFVSSAAFAAFLLQRKEESL